MFMFKKIVSGFLFPVPLVLIISIAGLVLLWFTKRHRAGKVIVTTGVLLLFFLSNSFISDCLLKPLERKYGPYESQLSGQNDTSIKERPVKFILVLGEGHTSDPAIPVTSQLNQDALARLIEGIRVYRKNPGSKMILSGGTLFDKSSHAAVMADAAVVLGVDENDIILEDMSKDTKDEALLIKAMVNDERFVLVTSAYHMPRSLLLFRKQGMDPVPAPTGHFVKDGQYMHYGSFFPDSFSLYKSKRALYEYLGIAWAKLRGQI